MAARKARHSTRVSKPINALCIAAPLLSFKTLALPLLVPGIGADHVHHPAATHNLAVLADLLDLWTHFHRSPIPIRVRTQKPRHRHGSVPVDSPFSSDPDNG